MTIINYNSEYWCQPLCMIGRPLGLNPYLYPIRGNPFPFLWWIYSLYILLWIHNLSWWIHSLSCGESISCPGESMPYPVVNPYPVLVKPFPTMRWIHRYTLRRNILYNPNNNESLPCHGEPIYFSEFPPCPRDIYLSNWIQTLSLRFQSQTNESKP